MELTSTMSPLGAYSLTSTLKGYKCKNNTLVETP